MDEAPSATDLLFTAPISVDIPSFTFYEDISVDQLASNDSNHGAVGPGPIQPDLHITEPKID